MAKNKQNNNAENSKKKNILEALGSLFNPEPQKEKVLRHEDFNGAGDVYYATVSVGFKITQRVFVLVLVLFLIISFATNFREITYENFFYLLKDFSSAFEIETTAYETLSYDSDSRHFFALYRGGLTVVNPSNLSVFTATGRRTVKTASSFSSPCVVSSDKYFVVYDTAGTEMAIYNSFSRIYKETFEYPISGASFDDDGNLAIITRDTDHKSLVHVYNDNFKRMFTVPSSTKYAFDVAMNSHSDRLAIAYYGVGDGSGRTEIVFYSVATEPPQEIDTVTVDGEFLLDCGFVNENLFAVVTNRTVRLYDKHFEELDSYGLENGVVSGFCINEYGVGVSYTVNSSNNAIVFDSRGNIKYDEIVNDNVRAISVFEGFVFLRTDAGVVRVDMQTLDEEFLTSGQGKMLIYSADTALVCGDSKAEYLVFGD